MPKEEYLITIRNKDEERNFILNKGETLMLKTGRKLVIGVTDPTTLGPNIIIEPVTKENKDRVKQIKKLMKTRKK